MRLAALEELVARGAEPLPQLVALLARQVAGLLPLRLQRLELLGGRGPVGRLGERLGLGDQRLLGLGDLGELLVLDGAQALHALVDRIADRLELIPQLLRAALRHRADFLPQRLERAQPVAEIRRRLGASSICLGRRDQRLGLRHVLDQRCQSSASRSSLALIDQLAARGGVAIARARRAARPGTLPICSNAFAACWSSAIDRASDRVVSASFSMSSHSAVRLAAIATPRSASSFLRASRSAGLGRTPRVVLGLALRRAPRGARLRLGLAGGRAGSALARRRGRGALGRRRARARARPRARPRAARRRCAPARRGSPCASRTARRPS